MKLRKKQAGIVLMLMATILVIVGTTLFVKQINAQTISAERQLRTSQALQEAKAVLLGYAMSYDDDPTRAADALYGYLPCPDSTTHTGAGSEASCGTSGNSILLGRFPWKNLKTTPIRDGYGECLWYAVSEGYKSNPKVANLNPTRQGELRVIAPDGSYHLGSNANPIVAVVIAPNARVSEQSRADTGVDVFCGGNYDASNYLDTANNVSNADISDLTFTMQSSDTMNDQFIFITQSEVFAHYCQKYTKQFATQIDVANNTNSCNASTEALTSCENLRDDKIAYCASSCQTATNTLTNAPCLSDLSDPSCQAAINDLSACYA